MVKGVQNRALGAQNRALGAQNRAPGVQNRALGAQNRAVDVQNRALGAPVQENTVFLSAQVGSRAAKHNVFACF